MTEKNANPDNSTLLSTQISRQQVEDITHGADFLNSGMNNSASDGLSLLTTLPGVNKSLKRISLEQVSDTANIMTLGLIGTLSSFKKHPPSFNESRRVFNQFEQTNNIKFDALLPLECAGINATYPLFVATQLGIPIIDADCTGCSFPDSRMTTPNIKRIFKHFKAIVCSNDTLHSIELESLNELANKARLFTHKYKGFASIVFLHMTGKEVKSLCLPHMLSVAEIIGKTMRLAHGPATWKIMVLNNILQKDYSTSVDYMFRGRVIKSLHTTELSQHIGCVALEEQSIHQYKKIIEIGYQERYLIVRTKQNNQYQTLASAPDIITLLNAKTLQVITHDSIQDNQDVIVLNIRAPRRIISTNQVTYEKVNQLLNHFSGDLKDH